MEAADEETPLLHLQSPQDVGSEYTSDGSVDINNQRALKHNTGNWRACFMILGVEFCECTAFFAIAKNLVTYLTTVLHESKVTAARNASAWAGTCFLTPLIGAFLADTYWGRYWTVVVFLPVYIVGMLVLTVSASLPVFSTSSYHGEVHPAVVYLGLYLAALGSGGVKPCTSTFGADQFDSADPQELVKKGSFFNWYYFLISTSSLLSGTVLVWLQDNVGWGVSFAIPTVLMVFSLAVFIAGSRVYRYRKQGVSPLRSLCQVVVAAVRKWHLRLPDDISLLYELTSSPSATEASHKIQHTNQFRFLDKAAIVLPPSDKKCIAPTSSWSLCTVTQVEEMKMLLRMSPIWASFVIFYAVAGQMASTFVEQGMVMDNRVGPFAIPPASLSIFGVFSVLIWVPIYETVLVPLARRFTGKEKGFSQTQRLGVGLALSMLTMVYSALLEMKRLAITQASGLADQNVPVPMSILWQAPSYFLHGAAEVFATIGVTEFFYDQAPDAMRSLCAALGQLAIASGAYFNTFVFGVVAMATTRGGSPGWIPDNLNEGHLDYFFWMMAALSLLNLVLFVPRSMRAWGYYSIIIFSRQHTPVLHSSKKTEIPNGRVGVIIGKSGDTIKYLQQQSGAKIQVTRDMDAEPGAQTRPVELSGTPEQISKAEQMINAVLADADAGSSGTVSTRKYNAPQPGSEQFQMKIANNKVGLVIGKGGETIKNMQIKSGAHIQVRPLHLPPGDTSTERTVYIEGTQDQIEIAKQLVNEVTSENRSRNPMSGGYSQQGYRPPHPQTNWGPPGAPPMQQPGYGYMQPGAYPGAPPQYGAPQQSYGSYPPASGGYQTGWDQSSNQQSQQTPPGTGYDYYNQQQQPQQQQSAPGTATPADATSYNYGQPPTYASQGYGDSTYSQQSGGQQAYGHDSYSGYQTQGQQQGYSQQTGYDQQSYGTSGYGSAANSAQDGSAPNYGAPGGASQASPGQQTSATGSHPGYSSQPPTSAASSYPVQGSAPQSGYGAPPPPQPSYGTQPPPQGGYGQGAYGQPPQGQKPPTSAPYGQAPPPGSVQGGYGQYGYSHSQPGYGAPPPYPGAPPANHPGYGQQQSYGDPYGSGSYGHPPVYSTEATTPAASQDQSASAPGTAAPTATAAAPAPANSGGPQSSPS